METQTKPRRGIEIVRRMLEVKRQAQRESVENYRNNPEVRAVIEKLKKANGKPESA
jgi:hypothetical protein